MKSINFTVSVERVGTVFLKCKPVGLALFFFIYFIHRTPLKHYHKVALFGLLCFVLAFFINKRIFEGDGMGWRGIITSDGRGYYAYLPALIIDGDPTFGKVAARESAMQGPGYAPGYLVEINGHPVNKYFAGEALLLLPFFLLGFVLSLLIGTPLDGYSFFFQISAGIGALFYLMMGLVYFSRILQYFHVRPFVLAWMPPVLLFGTNLFYYSLWDPTMSHLYSFFAINGFLWYSLAAIRDWNNRYAILTGLFLGLTVLIRPINGTVIALIPFLAHDLTTLGRFLQTLWCKKKVTWLFLLIFTLLILIQPTLWFIQTGKFLLWPYHNEGFRFDRPEIFNSLFSFRKGLFVYTPLIFLSWLGLGYLAVANRLRFFSMLVFMALSTYIISSWWSWYYGDGFGLRAYIDYYGIYFLLLALSLNQLRRKMQQALLVLLVFPLVFLNLFQTWQYTHDIIHPNSMDFEKYAWVFLKADSASVKCLGEPMEIADYTVDLKSPDFILQNDFEKEYNFWNNLSTVSSSRSYSPNHVGYLDSIHPFSPGLEIPTDKLGSLPSRFFVEGSLQVWDSISGASNKALVVLSMENITAGVNYWQGFLLNKVPRNDIKRWRECLFSLTLPEIANPGGILKIYVWNTGKGPFLLDDFRIRLYRAKDH